MRFVIFIFLIYFCNICFLLSQSRKAKQCVCGSKYRPKIRHFVIECHDNHGLCASVMLWFKSKRYPEKANMFKGWAFGWWLNHRSAVLICRLTPDGARLENICSGNMTWKGLFLFSTFPFSLCFLAVSGWVAYFHYAFPALGPANHETKALKILSQVNLSFNLWVWGILLWRWERD